MYDATLCFPPLLPLLPFSPFAFHISTMIMIYVWHVAGAAANRIWHLRFAAVILVRFVTEGALVVEIGFL